MRRLSLLLVLLLVLAACGDDGDGDDQDSEESPTPTESVDEDTEEPTPEPTSTPEPEPTEESDDETSDEATPTEEDADTAEAPQSLDERLDEITQNVVELRGLELQEELDFSTMSRDELRELLEEEVALEAGDIDLFWILRLIDDRDLNLEEILVDAQAADIYGLYDPETQETYVIAEDEELSILEEVIVAHEIVHALQDQYYDLGRLESLEPDYDALSAFQAMVEGDATLAQELYVQQYLTEEELVEFQQEAMAATQNQEAQAALEALPRYFSESFSFPYLNGAQFLLQAYDGTFEQVNGLLEDPPTSTQQVMNPQAYFAGEIEDPMEVDLPDVSGQIGDGWEIHDEGTLGTFDLTMMLEENGATTVDEAIDGWRGTGFVMYLNEDQVLSIVETRWASEEDATEFEDALVETMADYSEEEGIWTDGERYFSVTTEGDAVTLNASTNPDALSDVMGAQ